MNLATINSDASFNKLELVWQTFKQSLSDSLEKMDAGQFLILSVKHSSLFIQFASQGNSGIRVEVTSNHFLDTHEQLKIEQVASLIEIGWIAPSNSPALSTPHLDPEGSPNYFAEFPVPINFGQVANFAVRTASVILGVQHPANLTYKAFNTTGNEIYLPNLGLAPEVTSTQMPDSGNLLHQHLVILSEITGLCDLFIDDTEKIAVHYERFLVFVRLIGEPPSVQIFSPILQKVDEDQDIHARLNEVNANVTFARFFIQDDTIFCAYELSALPFVENRFAEAFMRFCDTAHEISVELQKEFGGLANFEYSKSSTRTH